MRGFGKGLQGAARPDDTRARGNAGTCGFAGLQFPRIRTFFEEDKR